MAEHHRTTVKVRGAPAAGSPSPRTTSRPSRSRSPAFLEAIALIVFASLVIAFVRSVVPYLADK
jgi:hypothetical protein